MRSPANPRPRPSPIFSRAAGPGRVLGYAWRGGLHLVDAIPHRDAVFHVKEKSPYQLPHIIAAWRLLEKACRDSAPWHEQQLLNASTQWQYLRQTFLHRLASTGVQFEPPTTFCCQYVPCRPIRPIGIRSEMKRVYGINGASKVCAWSQPLLCNNVRSDAATCRCRGVHLTMRSLRRSQ
jgi:hypothetical protein